MQFNLSRVFFFISILLLTQVALANPYWDPARVPRDNQFASSYLPLLSASKLKSISTAQLKNQAIDVLRIQVNWQANEIWQFSHAVIEPSGTTTLIDRSKQKPRLGSYWGILKNPKTGETFYDAVGTGKEYRKLARAVNFRFPLPKNDMQFELIAENPSTGKMEKVLSTTISINQLKKVDAVTGIEIKELARAIHDPTVRVNIYAEGYRENEKSLFWKDAAKTVRALQNENFPAVKHMNFYGVFHSSNKHLKHARNLGFPVPEYDTFLGLFYPYWDNFGRWYHVVYPTREDKLRRGLAAAPYDYVIVLINNSDYWGVGNYMSHTAIPASVEYAFTYLLIHEWGHYFGLNEEYEGGGRTELEFADNIVEPWSQNITFLPDNKLENLKWKEFVSANTPLPTPDNIWDSKTHVYGAYEGGYADSGKKHQSHKPGKECIMNLSAKFCPICRNAIEKIVKSKVELSHEK